MATVPLDGSTVEATQSPSNSARADSLRNYSGTFVPNERPISVEMDGPQASHPISLKNAKRLVAELSEAIESVEDVHDVLDMEAGRSP